MAILPDVKKIILDPNYIQRLAEISGGLIGAAVGENASSWCIVIPSLLIFLHGMVGPALGVAFDKSK